MLSLSLTLTACEASTAVDEPNDNPGSSDDELATGVPWVSAEGVSSLVYEGDPERAILPEPGTLERRFGHELNPPYVQSAPGATLKPWDYLRRMSALGHGGPVGHFGPLGPDGPIGDSATSPDTAISGMFPWSSWARFFTAMGGPLSALGPLGRNGPANPIFWEELPERLDRYWRERPNGSDVMKAFTSDFLVHLRPGGIFGIVGPTGPLGAFGPLGPLGPIGAHGYLRRDGGDYQPNAFDSCHNVTGDRRNPPCRTVDVDWSGGERRTYELFETYSEAKAKSLNDKTGDAANDTSFLVKGTIPSPDAEIDEYVFHSKSSQWVMISLVPESAKYKFHQLVSGNSGCDKTILAKAKEGNFEAPDGTELELPDVESSTKPCAMTKYEHRGSFDDFDLELSIINNGRKAAKIASKSRDMVDWIEVLVPAGSTLVARVSLARVWKPAPADAAVGIVERTKPPTYRMIVVGSSPHFILPTRFAGPFSKRQRFE